MSSAANRKTGAWGGEHAWSATAGRHSPSSVKRERCASRDRRALKRAPRARRHVIPAASRRCNRHRSGRSCAAWQRRLSSCPRGERCDGRRRVRAAAADTFTRRARFPAFAHGDFAKERRKAAVMLHPRSRCGSGSRSGRDASATPSVERESWNQRATESITESPERSRPAKRAADAERRGKFTDPDAVMPVRPAPLPSNRWRGHRPGAGSKERFPRTPRLVIRKGGFYVPPDKRHHERRPACHETRSAFRFMSVAAGHARAETA